jgi:tetratricopeptide (TPR) repeat protein
MRIVRALLAIAVLIVAGLAIVRETWTVERCNMQKRKAEAFLGSVEQIASDFDRERAALAAAERMERCVAETPNDWQAHFLSGALYGVAGRTAIARTRYTAALALEERPEIYIALSLLQFANGEPEEGLKNAEKATGFNLEYANEFEPDLRAQLWHMAKERERRLKGETQ